MSDAAILDAPLLDPGGVATTLRDFLHDTLLSTRARQRGLLRSDHVKRLIEGEQAFGRQLWGLLCQELWYRAFIDGEYRQHQPAAVEKAIGDGAS